MSGIGFSELVLLFVIGLLILGPERLPRVASQIGRWVGRARRTANQLRYQLEREIALADIERRDKDRGKQEPPEKTGASATPGDAGKTQSSTAAPDSKADQEPADSPAPAEAGTASTGSDGDDSDGRV